MKPEHTACTSKAAPLVMPRPAWILTAVAGNVRSGVAVAQMMRSMSMGSMPERTSAWREAAMPRSEVSSPSSAMWRSLDAGALPDPFVGGVDDAGQVVVGHDALGQVGTHAADDRSNDCHCSPRPGHGALADHACLASGGVFSPSLPCSASRSAARCASRSLSAMS